MIPISNLFCAIVNEISALQVAQQNLKIAQGNTQAEPAADKVTEKVIDLLYQENFDCCIL